MTIEERGDGYRVKIRILGVSESKSGFPTKAAAKSWKAFREAEIRAASEAGVSVESGARRHTLRDAIIKYRDNEANDRRSPGKLVIRLNYMLRRTDATLLNRPLASVTPDMLSTWARGRSREVAPASVLREVMQFSALFSTARKSWRWLPANHENPCSRMWRPKAPPPRDRLVSDDERDRLLAKLDYREGEPLDHPSRQTALAFLVALQTAMRTSEILGITRATFDPARRVVSLPITKNGHAREVPLTLEAVRLLQRLTPGPDGRLFSIVAGDVDDQFWNARNRLPEGDSCHSITFRDSRATALTRMAGKVDALTLAKISGHRDLKILLHTYYRRKAEDIAKMLD